MTWFDRRPRGSCSALVRPTGESPKRPKPARKALRLQSIENLEQRQMLSFEAHVNFQPEAWSTAPSGYIADLGKTYAPRNGQTYGWTGTQGPTIFDRWSSDQLRRSFASMQWNGSYTWEMAVPNGTYEVHVTAGDANGWNEAQKINAENVTVLNQTTTATNRWVDGTATVSVLDGKLTISNGSTTANNKINFVDIRSLDGTTVPPTTPPTVPPPPPVVVPPTTPPTVPPTTPPTVPPTTPPTVPPTTPPTTGTPIKINFQPGNMPAPSGFLVDAGNVYGSRGNLSYGWNATGIHVIDRWSAADQLKDTLAAMQYGGNFTWELGLANGTYQVHVVAGDANGWNNRQSITAEGSSVVDATTTSTNRWVEGTSTVTVIDGRLTIANGAGAQNNTINYIEITPAGSTTVPPTTPPTVPPTTPPTVPPTTPPTVPPTTPPTVPPTTPPTTPPPPPPSNTAIIGTNLDGLADWATIGAFNDLATLFRPWGSMPQAYNPDPTIPLTADNYPLRDAGAITYAYGYPDGRYLVSYDGIGSLSFMGFNAKYTVTSHVGDRWTGYLDMSPKSMAGNILEMRITGINPANPVRNLHIISPDANNNISDTFRPVFLDKLKAFNGPLRYMDWMQTNSNPSVNWSDRAKTTRFSYSSETGVPYEHIAKLANTLNKDLWINIPYGATEDYIRQMARFFRDNVNPNLRVYVEFSNEVWNPGMGQMVQNQKAAWADPTLTRTDDFGRQAQKFGRLSGRAAQIFKEEFGATRYTSQVRFELGALIANTYWAQTALDQVKRDYGDPKNLFYGIAVAPYVGVPGDMASIDNSTLTLDKLFNWMNGFIDNTIVPWTRQHKSLADQFGLKLDSYEAGQSLSYLNWTNVDIKTAAQTDPRMGDMYRHLITAWTRESGGGVFGNFALSTNWGPYGFWGLFQKIDELTSVKYAAVTGMAGKTV